MRVNKRLRICLTAVCVAAAALGSAAPSRSADPPAAAVLTTVEDLVGQTTDNLGKVVDDATKVPGQVLNPPKPAATPAPASAPAQTAPSSPVTAAPAAPQPPTSTTSPSTGSPDPVRAPRATAPAPRAPVIKRARGSSVPPLFRRARQAPRRKVKPKVVVRRVARRPAPPAVTLRAFVSLIPKRVKLLVIALATALLGALALILRSRRQLAAALKRAHHDAVTGLPNRAAAQDTLALLGAQAARERSWLAVVVLDLDQFKSVNDTYGHAAGDRVLEALGETATGLLRAGDFVARFGGEEFILLLPRTTEAGARRVAEKLRLAVRQADMGIGRPVTASFGVAAGLGAEIRPQALVAAADEALYSAKDNGRDRVETAGRSSPSFVATAWPQRSEPEAVGSA